MNSIKPWKQLKTQELFRTKFFKLRRDVCELPDQRIMPKYYIFDFSDWVNIVPVTCDGQIVLIEQYRHGCQEVCWEIPGGALDSHLQESPIDAAKRELTEETGYVAGSVAFVAEHKPNPALQSNTMHTFVAFDCELEQKQSLDPFEDIRVVPIPYKELFEMVDTGQINHSLILASLFLARPFIQRHLFP